LSYTIIGSNVSIAKQLCKAAKEMEILISEQTYQEKGVKEHFEVEQAPDVVLEGLDKTVVVYRIKGQRR